MKINGVPVQSQLVSGTNIKTINSTSLLGSGDLVTASPSGVAGAIQFSNGSAFSSDAALFFWDNTNKRFAVGTNSPTARAQIKGTGATNATTSLLVQNSAGTNSLQCTDDLSVFSHGKGAVASNTIFGKGAFQGTSPTGANNTAFGATALAAVTSGAANTAIGSGALLSITTGANNTCIGQSTYSFGTGSGNTVIGSGAMALTFGATTNNTAVGAAIICSHSNCTLLGYGATSTASNQFVVGSAGTVTGAVAAEVNTSANVWNVIINGVARKILLA